MPAPGYVRLAYCVSHETIVNAMPGFKKLAKSTAGEPERLNRQNTEGEAAEYERVGEAYQKSGALCAGGTAKRQRIIKLNTNENPYPPAPGVLEALKRLEGEGLRKYPDPAAADLTEALAENYGVGTDQVFVGVGSDDVLAMCFLTFF